MCWMFTYVSEERPASVVIENDDDVGKRLKNHIPEDYLNDKGEKQSAPPRTGDRRGS
jgi:hypothetical protein